MSKSTISTFQLFQMFPDAESTRVYLESRLWPDGAVCPACKAMIRKGLGAIFLNRKVCGPPCLHWHIRREGCYVMKKQNEFEKFEISRRK